MFTLDAVLLDQISKGDQFFVVDNVVEMSDALVYPRGKVKSFFVDSEVRIIPDRCEL